ncbi:hypothetical protein [Streptomyces pratensis]|uniref:hypothetical protein n=1 Tax=Streptomyces pratensis TaxID=1169025 RepID=UPI001932AD51|nr:hypothetical protein [Streptomyces pratensis]
MKPGLGPRAVRAATFAAVCVLLAATGHVLMSGAQVPGWVLLAAFTGTTLTAWALAGHERGPAAVTSVAVVVQTALHVCFTLAQSLVQEPAQARPVSFARQWAEELLCGDGAKTISEREAVRIVTDAGLGSVIFPPPGTPGTPGAMSAEADGRHHAVHVMADHGSPSVGAAMHGGHDTVAMSPTGMLAAHFLAALLCGLWLAYGERAVFRLLRAFAGRLRTPLQLLLCLTPTPGRPRPRLRHPRAVRAFRQLLLVHIITSRGPPTGTAVA